MATTLSGARVFRRILVVLLVLAVIVVAADRVGDYVAERIAADSIQDSQNLANRPDVDIDGIPFLTQFAAGEYDKITVTATDVPVGQSPVTVQISTISLVLHDLTVSRDFKTFHAASATATGVIGYASLSKALGADISYQGNGRIKADKKLTFAGQTINPTISVSPKLVNGVLSFGKSQLNGLGDLAGAASSALNDIFDVSVPLQGIPFEVKLRSLSVDKNGLRLQLAGSDLSYTTS